MTDLKALGLTGIPTKKDILRKRIQDGEIAMPVLPSNRLNWSAAMNKMTPAQLECIKQGLYQTPETLGA